MLLILSWSEQPPIHSDKRGFHHDFT